MKSFAFFVLGGILGVVAGAGGMLVVFPFIFPPPQVDETAAAGLALVGETRFREDSSGQDAGHWGRGGVKFYRDADGAIVAELQTDFEVGPGPNFWLYLNSESGIEDEKDFYADESRIKTHKLKSFGGSQVYKLKADEFAEARAFTIWCESFGQYIASADIPLENES